MPTDIPGKLLEAIRDLGRTKNPDELSVRTLTDYCGISRQTFYYYFNDIEDFLDYVNRRGFEDGIRQCERAGSAQEALRIYLDGILLYYDRIEKRLIGKTRLEEERNIHDSTLSFCRVWIRRFPQSAQMNHDDVEFLVSFVANGIASMIIWHGKDGLDTGKISAQIESLVRAGLERKKP